MRILADRAGSAAAGHMLPSTEPGPSYQHDGRHPKSAANSAPSSEALLSVAGGAGQRCAVRNKPGGAAGGHPAATAGAGRQGAPLLPRPRAGAPRSACNLSMQMPLLT